MRRRSSIAANLWATYEETASLYRVISPCSRDHRIDAARDRGDRTPAPWLQATRYPRLVPHVNLSWLVYSTCPEVAVRPLSWQRHRPREVDGPLSCFPSS